MNNLSRRNFISLSAKGAIAAPLLSADVVAPDSNTVLSADSYKQKEEPKFRFLQINDLHIQSINSRYQSKIGATYQNANARAFWLLEAMQNTGFFPPLDFVLAIGDLVHGGTLDGVKYDMDFFYRHFVSAIPIPLYPVMGNHENVQQEGNPENEEPYIQAFGKDKLNYSFVHKGLHFIVLNNSGTWAVNDPRIIGYRLATFKEMLDKEPDLPKIICCHIPLIPVREKKVLAESFGFRSYYTKEPELLALIEQNKKKVLAVLSGHLHLSGVVKEQSVYHISLSGLASYPHDMAIYSVFENSIEAEFIRVPSDLLEPSTNIHGAGRHRMDYRDNLHPDYTSYIMGIASERRFTMPIRKS